LLYLIATPIGNLSDFSFRAVETCQKCDYLLCEDTRRSSILLKHYDIHKPLKSYHLFNESAKLNQVLKDLESGLEIGLISDGGTPALCDPGELLVKTCREKQLPITTIPGPCALIQALISSGFPTHPFQFLGFMPRKETEILHILPSIFSYPGTSIFYESPQRLLSTLLVISRIAPETQVAVARELTKTYEEVLSFSALEAHAHFLEKPVKGEVVLLIKGMEESFASKEPKELVDELIATYKISLTEAIKTAAHLLKMPKQNIYKMFHSEK
jgi:16S rRNA (cytidine1402-2'-O)-methyltransferase